MISEEVALSNVVTAYIEQIKTRVTSPSFNGFYEYVRDDYREILVEKSP